MYNSSVFYSINTYGIFFSPPKPWRSTGEKNGSYTNKVSGLTQGNTSTSGDFELRGSPAGSSESCSIIDSKPRPHAGIQGASAVRMSHLYKKMLTVQVLFLGAHHFMSGGFADRSRNSGARHAVLSGSDPIRERLARHLLRPRLSPPLLRERRGDGPALNPQTLPSEHPGRASSSRTAAPFSSVPALVPPLGTNNALSPAGETRSRGSSTRAGPSRSPSTGSGPSLVTPSRSHSPCRPPHPSGAPLSISTSPAT